MKVKNVTQEQMEKTLEIINQKYENNVTWNRFESNGKGFNFTLKVKNSKAPGHRLHISYSFNGLHSQKRSTSACWHVHGDFFDTLWDISPDAIIYSNGVKMTGKYDNWQDRNIGSQMFPVYFSESCECK